MLFNKPLTEPDHVWKDWAIAVGLWVLALGCLGGNALDFQRYKYLRLALSGMSVVSAGLALGKVRQIERRSPYIAQREIMRNDLFLECQASQIPSFQQQALPPAYQQPIIMPPPGVTPEIDWGEILAAPHLAVVGKTGSGKSALTQWLSTQLGGDIAVYDSDASPDEWAGLEVIGRGADYGVIAAAMQSDLEELQRRTELRAVGKNDFPPMVRILEESPETLSALKDNGHDVGYQWLKGILRRGRKYGIKLILLSQGFSVRSLRIEGEGELRDNISVLRLGKVALQYAKDESIKQALKAQQRPLLVEDELVGCVPDLSAFLASQKVGDRPTVASNSPEPVNHATTQNHIDREMLEHLYRAESRNHAPINEGAVKCPDCASRNVARHAKNRNGSQRYRCGDCGKTFTI